MKESSVYIESVTLKNIKCFKGDYQISVIDIKGKPIQWTVLLGNNNTGKTTFLRAVSELQAIPLEQDKVTRIEKNFIDKSPFPFVPQASSWTRQSPINPKTEVGLSQEISMLLLQCQCDVNFDLKGQSFKRIEQIGWFSKRNEYGRGDITIDPNGDLSTFIMYGYGALRRKSKTYLEDNQQGRTTDSLFFENTTLLNVEDWLLKTYLARSSKDNGVKRIADKRLTLIQNLFLSELFEDIRDFRIRTDDQLDSYVEFMVGKDWVSLESLGYGYQNSIIWLADLAKRMFDRYPDLENPLHGPAIVLVDEIDLHLHPEWQRKIIKYLSDLFPNTQFIVTAHSPLIVQSAENVNLIMLEKDDATGSINVRQQFGSFQGWTVEEILRELMDMGEKTRSDRFLNLLKDFEIGLDQDNYDGAKMAYDKLDKLLHPASSQRKLLSIQLSSLVPA